jgi:hypothetical protein
MLAFGEGWHVGPSWICCRHMAAVVVKKIQAGALLADTAYGSDANYARCERYGVELVAPVPGKASAEKTSGAMLSETDFPVEEREVIDGYGVKHVKPFIKTCPAGKEPHRSHYDYSTGTKRILHLVETCRDCPLRAKCPVEYGNGWMQVRIHAATRRTSRRSAQQETESFKSRYRQRSGIEATNSLLKRVTGLGRLRGTRQNGGIPVAVVENSRVEHPASGLFRQPVGLAAAGFRLAFARIANAAKANLPFPIRRSNCCRSRVKACDLLAWLQCEKKSMFCWHFYDFCRLCLYFATTAPHWGPSRGKASQSLWVMKNTGLTTLGNSLFDSLGPLLFR